MILPIEASMHTPRHFDLVLSGTMAAVTALYVAFGSVRRRRRRHIAAPRRQCATG